MNTLKTLFPQENIQICSLSSLLSFGIDHAFFLDEIVFNLTTIDAQFKSFLDEIIVVYEKRERKDRHGQEHNQNSQSVSTSISQILLIIIERLLKRGKPNVLTLGYRFPSINHTESLIRGHHQIENFFPNTMVTLLKSAEFSRLHTILGDNGFIYLLETASLFKLLPSGSLFQMCGTPVYESSIYGNARHVSIGRKRAADCQTNQVHVDKKPRTSSNTSSCKLQWSRIFYGRPISTAAGAYLIGFPQDNILVQSAANGINVGCKNLLESIFASYITINDANKKKPQSKIDRRMKIASNIFEEMVTRLPKVNFRRLLNESCPIPSTESCQPLLKDKGTSFLQLHCTYDQVFDFVFGVVRCLIPKELIGSVTNWNQLQCKIRQLIQQRRHEEMALDILMRGFKILEVPWSKSSRAGDHVPQSDLQKRKDLLACVLQFIVQSVIIPLIRTNFYVTETSPFKHCTFFFRHETWSRLCAPLYQHLRDNMLTVVSPETVMKLLKEKSFFGYSHLRFLPKSNGARPIMNLARKISERELDIFIQQGDNAREVIPGGLARSSSKGFKTISINSLLQNAFQILNFEKTRQSKLLGSSALGLNDIYTRLKSFKKSIFSETQPAPKLYFCKMDISACFDSIKQPLLMKILDSVVTEIEYVIQKYAMVYPSGGKLVRKFHKRAIPGDELGPFHQSAENNSMGSDNAILVDQVVYHFEDRKAVLELLKGHISNNLVRIGKNLYRQVDGIPQGSVMSTLLCSFFYGFMEQMNLTDFTEDPNSLMIRYVDDFLFITTDLTLASRFCDIMYHGFPEYGSCINREKILVNFDMKVDGQQLPRLPDTTPGTNPLFPWCGILIDTRRLDVQADYSKLEISRISDTLVVDVSSQPGATFRTKLYYYVKSKGHCIYFDVNMNRESTVLLNIYQHFLVCAMKFAAYERDCFAKTKQRNFKFLLEIIDEACQFMYSICRNRSKSSIAGENRFAFTIPKTHVIWLGKQAFIKVLKKKQSRYEPLIRSLQHDVSRLHVAHKKLISVLNPRLSEFINRVKY